MTLNVICLFRVDELTEALARQVAERQMREQMELERDAMYSNRMNDFAKTLSNIDQQRALEARSVLLASLYLLLLELVFFSFAAG